MATTNHHFYEQSSSSWHQEWADHSPDMDQMSDEEREEAENEARREIEKADDEAAAYRAWEREQAGAGWNDQPTFGAEGHMF
jgi:hypothetical protein